MDNEILRVEGLGKQYRLGEVGTGTISHDLNRWWAKIRGKDDPFLKVGEVNKRAEKGNSDYVWAIQDISFSVQQGDVLGIIGKNGAGKSTLLKILSKVTGPSTGKIYSNGKIAALLEVGTGFHPELTGRENIYLNGAILGMPKSEIQKKFDDIVSFSGVSRYVDTPVKRYSSGMMVRLGFAVAAHLEPDILIVDEVLAVGDAEFQKKCIGKMSEVSKEGRTVLFVSHNLSTVNQLCNKSLLMENGQLVYSGKTSDVIDKYLSNVEEKNHVSWLDEESIRKGNGKIRIQNISINENQNKISVLRVGESLRLKMELLQKDDLDSQSIACAVRICRVDDISLSNDENIDRDIELKMVGNSLELELLYEDVRLYPGQYKFQVFLGTGDWMEHFDIIDPFTAFEVINGSNLTKRELNSANGQFYMHPKWSILSS